MPIVYSEGGKGRVKPKKFSPGKPLPSQSDAVGLPAFISALSTFRRNLRFGDELQK